MTKAKVRKNCRILFGVAVLVTILAAVCDSLGLNVGTMVFGVACFFGGISAGAGFMIEDWCDEGLCLTIDKLGKRNRELEQQVREWKQIAQTPVKQELVT